MNETVPFNFEPFNLVEDPETLDNTKLTPICMQYDEESRVYCKRCWKKAGKTYSDKFGIVFDGWLIGGEYYIAISCHGGMERMCAFCFCCGELDEVMDEEGGTGFPAEDILFRPTSRHQHVMKDDKSIVGMSSLKNILRKKECV